MILVQKIAEAVRRLVPIFHRFPQQSGNFTSWLPDLHRSPQPPPPFVTATATTVAICDPDCQTIARLYMFRLSASQSPRPVSGSILPTHDDGCTKQHGQPKRAGSSMSHIASVFVQQEKLNHVRILVVKQTCAGWPLLLAGWGSPASTS